MYTTKDLELAKEWSVGFNRSSQIGYVYELELNTTGLRLLDLNKYPIETWLSILYKNRKIENLTNLVNQRMEEFITKFYIPEIKNYDVIIGYRADDSYFKYAEDFLNVAITKEVLEQALYLGNLGQQIFIQTEKGFKMLKRSYIREAMDACEPRLLNMASINVLERYLESDVKIKYTKHPEIYRPNELYWVGSIYAYLSVYKDISSKKLIEILPFRELLGMYNLGHEMGNSSFSSHVEI